MQQRVIIAEARAEAAEKTSQEALSTARLGPGADPIAAAREDDRVRRLETELAKLGGVGSTTAFEKAVARSEREAGAARRPSGIVFVGFATAFKMTTPAFQRCKNNRTLVSL